MAANTPNATLNPAVRSSTHRVLSESPIAGERLRFSVDPEPEPSAAGASVLRAAPKRKNQPTKQNDSVQPRKKAPFRFTEGPPSFFPISEKGPGEAVQEEEEVDSFEKLHVLSYQTVFLRFEQKTAMLEKDTVKSKVKDNLRRVLKHANELRGIFQLYCVAPLFQFIFSSSQSERLDDCLKKLSQHMTNYLLQSCAGEKYGYTRAFITPFDGFTPCTTGYDEIAYKVRLGTVPLGKVPLGTKKAAQAKAAAQAKTSGAAVQSSEPENSAGSDNEVPTNEVPYSLSANFILGSVGLHQDECMWHIRDEEFAFYPFALAWGDPELVSTCFDYIYQHHDGRARIQEFDEMDMWRVIACCILYTERWNWKKKRPLLLRLVLRDNETAAPFVFETDIKRLIKKNQETETVSVEVPVGGGRVASTFMTAEQVAGTREFIQKAYERQYGKSWKNAGATVESVKLSRIQVTRTGQLTFKDRCQAISFLYFYSKFRTEAYLHPMHLIDLDEVTANTPEVDDITSYMESEENDQEDEDLEETLVHRENSYPPLSLD